MPDLRLIQQAAEMAAETGEIEMTYPGTEYVWATGSADAAGVDYVDRGICEAFAE